MSNAHFDVTFQLNIFFASRSTAFFAVTRPKAPLLNSSIEDDQQTRGNRTEMDLRVLHL